MLDDIGLFDEDFFAYLEDVDLAWRGQWAGWQCRLAPAAVVHHLHSATGAAIPHFKSRLLGRNRIWMIAKNYPLRYLIFCLPLFFTLEIGALIFLASQGRLSSGLGGRMDALGRLQVAVTKRTQIVRRISDRQMMARLRPIELPAKLLRRYRHVADKQ